MTVFFVFAQATQAATLEYSGCFEQSTDGANRILWMQAPVCTVTLTPDEDITALAVTIQNIDPRFYRVTNTANETLVTTSEENTLTFALDATASQTITIAPWDGKATSATDFWFAAIADNQPEADGGASPNPTFLSIMEQLQPLHMPFLTDSGDLIDGSETNAVSHNQEYVDLYNVFADYEGSTFVIPGDHDAKNDLDLYYSSYFGARDYTFTYGNTHFVAFNDTEDVDNEGELTDDQMTWVHDQLASTTEEHLIVLMHHPLVAPDWADSPGFRNEEQAQQLAEWYVEFGVDLVITGEVHGYDYRYVTDTDFPGIGGGFYQLINGGAGGTFHAYDGEHFYTLVHVTDEGITHQRIQLPDSDIALAYTTANDGTGSAVSASITNNGFAEIPSMRVPALLSEAATSEPLYASTAEGQFYTVTSETFNGVRYAYAELAVDDGTQTTLTFQTQRTIIAGVPNTIDADGVITFTTLPEAGSVATDMQVTESDAQTELTVANWDRSLNTRDWTEATTSHNNTHFSISGLLPNRQYKLTVNDTLRERLTTNGSGVLSFTFNGKATTRDYHIALDTRIVPQTIGVAPSGDRAPTVRLFDAETHEQQESFNVYDSALRTGISSTAIDTDGDGVLELATVPDAGTPGHVRVFTQDGDVVDSIFPYDNDFTGGITLAAADINGDGTQELITAPQSHHKATINAYQFVDGQLTKIDTVRAYKTSYHGGVNIAVGDVDNDGDDEIVVGARKTKETLKIYHWSFTKNVLYKLTTKKPFEGTDNSTLGFSLAVGDVDFNGKEDVIVGSYSGSSTLYAYKYKRSTDRLKKISSLNAFGSAYVGGVDLYAANVNKTEQDEILVVGRAGTAESATITTLNAASSHMQSLGSVTPFGSGYTSGLHVSFIDVDSDFRAEVATSREVGEDRVRVYDKRSGGYTQTDSFAAYDADFTGGLRLTQ